MGYCKTRLCKTVAGLKRDIWAIAPPPPHFGELEEDINCSMIPEIFLEYGVPRLCIPCFLEASIEELRRGGQDRN